MTKYDSNKVQLCRSGEHHVPPAAAAAEACIVPCVSWLCRLLGFWAVVDDGGLAFDVLRCTDTPPESIPPAAVLCDEADGGGRPRSDRLLPDLEPSNYAPTLSTITPLSYPTPVMMVSTLPADVLCDEADWGGRPHSDSADKLETTSSKMLGFSSASLITCLMWKPLIFLYFYRATAKHTHGIVVEFCPSVRLSNACIVTKRKHIAKKVQLWLTGSRPRAFQWA